MEQVQGDENSHTIRYFTRRQIECITEDYKTLLGKGAFGKVYQGVMDDESMVAVKRLMHNVTANFHQELTVHIQINHRNVVRLIGYCQEEDELMIVTEYISNGNLSDALHNNNISIPLDIRLRIAMECAEALAYMHSHKNTQVIHGDIKPDNILLDDSLHAKLSDFGVARLIKTDSSTYTDHVIGSRGYMDPLFVRDGRLTVKTDVYSFGVVLLELITRKKATAEPGTGSILYLFTDARTREYRGVRELFDAEIANQSNMKIFDGIAKLAGECLRMERDKRPEMITVAERLRMLSKTLHQGQPLVDLFSWLRKSKPAPTATASTSKNTSFLCRRFSIAEMKAATRNFDKSLLVGDSALGRVYHGKLDAGATKVAIKRFNSWLVHYAYEFNAEIQMMSKLRHRHLVSLIGYCVEKDEMLLVYDYIAHGSLHERLCNTQDLPLTFLAKKRKKKDRPLTWKERLNICIDVARGLDYLHTSSEHAIIHGKLKLTNILLGKNLVAMITDVGLSKPGVPIDIRIFWDSHVLNDPEYTRSRPLTVKSDVYSFGIVLFEVLYGRPIKGNVRVENQQNIMSMLLGTKWYRIDQIIDPYLKENVGQQPLDKFSRIAAKCISDQGTHRPSMGDVLSELKDVLRM